MARLPYLQDDGRSDELRQLYAEIAELRGSVHHLHQALANQPAALRAFMATSRHIRDESSLPPRLRELAVLATAYALDVEYEKFHHRPAARKVGVSEEQLAAFPGWRESNQFSPAERAVMDYADQVARRRDCDDATFAALKDHLTDAQIADLAFTVGWYHLCAAIIGPLRIETEGS